MRTRGRGMIIRTRGGSRVSRVRDSPPQIPFTHSPSHSPGATFNRDPSANGDDQSPCDDHPNQIDQSSVNDNQSIEVEVSDDIQPTEIPSTEESNAEVDRRLIVKVARVATPRRFIPSRLTKEIISNVILRMPYPAENWNSYCPQMKEQLFKDFQEKYHFATDYDFKMAKDVWERTCFDRYSDVLSKARTRAFNEVRSMNLVDLKGHGPKGMRTEVWNGLVDIWMTPKWQKKSIAGKNNRASKPECMVHTGGSRSFGDHKKMMENELKRPVSYNEVYMKVHKKKNGEFVSDKAKKFVESYEDAMIEKYGEDTMSHPEVDPDLWLQLGGENKKPNKILGLGHSLDLTIHSSSQASSSDLVGPSMSVMPTRNEDMTVAITSAISSLMPQLQAQIKEQVQVEMRAHTEVQAKMHADIMQYLQKTLPISQTHTETQTQALANP